MGKPGKPSNAAQICRADQADIQKRMGGSITRLFAYQALVALFSLTAASRSAYGIATIMLSDGVNTVTIADEGGCVGSGCGGFSTSSPGVFDLAPATIGRITVRGSLGVWLISVLTGASKPVIGSATNPTMDFVTNVSLSTGAGTITIKFTDDGFGPIPTGSTFDDAFGGLTDGTVAATQLYDAANGAFTGVQIASLGPFGGPAFSGMTSTSGVAGAAPFSLTQVVTITHPGPGITSFDYSKEAVLAATPTPTPTATPTQTPTDTPTQTPTPTIPIALGQPCISGIQCGSGFCTSGVCCNTGCTNAFESCNLPGSIGLCRPQHVAPVASRRGLIALGIILLTIGLASLRSTFRTRRS